LRNACSALLKPNNSAALPACGAQLLAVDVLNKTEFSAEVACSAGQPSHSPMLLSVPPVFCQSPAIFGDPFLAHAA
jgi:hypothetical protein